MENTAIQNVTIKSPAAFNFKSKKLNEYSAQIARIGQEMADRNVQLAIILGKVKSEKAYVEDAFKSVGEYAEETFGLKKAMAYQLANVGERFYNSKTSTAQKVVAMLTPSNMAEIAGLDDAQIEKGIAAGQISAHKSQKELREIAKGAKTGGVEVVQDKLVDILASIVTAGSDKVIAVKVEHTTIGGFIVTEIEQKYGLVETISKRVSGNSKEGVELLYSKRGFAQLVYKPSKPMHDTSKKVSKQKFTIAELEAMLKAAKDEQGND